MKIFENISVGSKVDVVNGTLLNIFWNYTPNKEKCYYRQPPWTNKVIHKLLKETTRLTRHYFKNGQNIEGHKKVLKGAEYSKKRNIESKKWLKMANKINDPRLLKKHTGLSQTNFYIIKISNNNSFTCWW